MIVFTTLKTSLMRTLLVCSILVGIPHAQNPPELMRGGPPTTAAEKLQQNNVPLTTEGLTSALQSNSSEVRFLAATQLAYEGTTEALPAMRLALNHETDPLARINIAYALAHMGNRDGLKSLKDGCSQKKLEPHLRLLATRYLIDLHHNYCLKDVLDILQNVENPADKMQALSLLPQFGQLPEKDAQRMAALVLAALQDATPAVRISAGEVISAIGVKSDESSIEEAIERETDDVVRSQLQSDLQRLQKKYEQRQ